METTGTYKNDLAFGGMWLHVVGGGVWLHLVVAQVGFSSMEDLVASTVPEAIRLKAPLALNEPLSETTALAALREHAEKNQVLRSFIGMGYNGTNTPGVIQRNMVQVSHCGRPSSMMGLRIAGWGCAVWC